MIYPDGVGTADSASPRPAPAWAAAVVGGCLAVLCAAWAGANPPGGSPDEPSHFVKAYASATGQVGGEPYPRDVTLDDPRSLEWFRATGRSYRLPAGLVPPSSVQCFAFDPDRTPECQDLDPPGHSGDAEVLAPTHLGTYNPALYVPAGLAAATADTFATGAWRARWANVAISSGLLVAGALLVRRRGALALGGFAVAATPMVVFLASSVNTNGIEAAAALCLWAGVVRVVRSPGDASPAPWIAVGLSGAVLALSRPLGAAILAAVVVVAALLGWPRLRALSARARRRAVAVAVALTVAFAVSAAWAVLVMPSPDLDVGLAARSLDDALRDLPNQARQLVGIFGWNDTTMPLAAYLLAFAAIGGLGVAAFRVGDRRERAALVGLAAIVLVADVGIAVLIEAQIGFGMQARYVLPLAAGFPLLSADILAHRSVRGAVAIPPWTVPGLFAAAGTLHAVAFVANAHRYAVGRSASWTPPWDSRWSPDGGLAVWLGLAVVASAALALSGVTTGRADRQPMAAPVGSAAVAEG